MEHFQSQVFLSVINQYVTDRLSIFQKIVHCFAVLTKLILITRMKLVYFLTVAKAPSNKKKGMMNLSLNDHVNCHNSEHQIQ